MKKFEYLSADTRLTDELERRLMEEELWDQEGYDLAGALRKATCYAMAKIASLLSAPRKSKGLPGEYLFS
ncbi:MAG TPA: hypothetical protein VF285_13395 [Castellaniella sp.]|uniref:hypothetical protein n=1 Tax=Castellaniella sp. TaxID=1955812 RepID=UPI002F174321